jgi:hypothetical protein
MVAARRRSFRRVLARCACRQSDIKRVGQGHGNSINTTEAAKKTWRLFSLCNGRRSQETKDPGATGHGSGQELFRGLRLEIHMHSLARFALATSPQRKQVHFRDMRRQNRMHSLARFEGAHSTPARSASKCISAICAWKTACTRSRVGLVVHAQFVGI